MMIHAVIDIAAVNFMLPCQNGHIDYYFGCYATLTSDFCLDSSNFYKLFTKSLYDPGFFLKLNFSCLFSL